ncbi:unnamed protein product [Rotaria magnacalcarata]|uniref:Uncharacterized protein n=2 Tax=Rotaria magnacalcarata TaxID=392030 RepID=A0A816BIE8_9BILA|nr:unnamed protein product [Rotaria magnacalcarata]CAF4418176.1 unnamed protein product [Rotaria magnacalcarata]
MTDKTRENATKPYPPQFLPASHQEKVFQSSLIQSADELTKEINTASDNIQRSRDKALATTKEWQRKQLESIEQRYLNHCNDIEERFKRLMSLEQDLRTRLLTEIDEPLVKGNLTDETAVIVQKTIDFVRQDVWQLRWNAVTAEPKVPKAKKIADPPDKHQGFPKVFEQAAKDSNKQEMIWVGGWAKEAQNYKIITPSGLNSKKIKGMNFSRP